jgi:hypothetical protein
VKVTDTSRVYDNFSSENDANRYEHSAVSFQFFGLLLIAEGSNSINYRNNRELCIDAI